MKEPQAYRDFVLSVEDHFDAAHRLPHYIGKCNNLHGHTWHVRAEITYYAVPVGELKGQHDGMLLDFGDVKEVWEELDHAYLNDILENPTAELVTAYIYDNMVEIIKVDCPYAFQVVVTIVEGEGGMVSHTGGMLSAPIDTQFERNMEQATQQLVEAEAFAARMYALRGGHIESAIKVD